MSTRIEETSLNVSTAEREDLLRRTAQRSMILSEVRRRAVQQLRGALAAECPASQTPTGSEHEMRPMVGESQFYVLHFLVKNGPLTVSEIADACHVSVPAISRMLNHLEVNQLIERHVDPANRRVIRVVATDAGRAAKAEMTRRFESALENVLSPLTNAELADLITAFGHLERLVIDPVPAR